MIDVDNPVVKLCTDGARAEFEGRRQAAYALYRQAWAIAANDYEACIAAHYVARGQDSVEETLAWNLEALRRADALHDERISAFYPSLYVNVGHSYEQSGQMAEAQRFYDLAAAGGSIPPRVAGTLTPRSTD